MSVWFCKNLGDAMLAGKALDDIKSLFETEYKKSGAPKDMAIFIRHESEGRLHCDVKVFFSPASAVVATAVDAVACERPLPDGLDLLVGSDDSWPALFVRTRG